MTGFIRRWNVLRVRNFRNLFLGQAIPACGDGLTGRRQFADLR